MGSCLPRFTLTAMPPLPDPHRLRFGSYRTPRFRLGQIVFCAIRGECTIVGQTDALIPWPLGTCGHGRFLIMFDALERAVRQEASVAVCHHWGVTAQTVTVWRKALGVEKMNAGSFQVASELGKSPARAAGLKKAQAKASDPERRTKIAASRRGKKLSAANRAALLASHLGRKLSAETRRKMSETHKRRGTVPPLAKRWMERGAE